jgi:pimeloyl-ACP methyl ester carboxylesterase
VIDQSTADIERFDITVGSLTFQARQAGPPDGRPVILLHGAPQTSACWNQALAALGAAGYHAVAFSQRGYSPGARPDGVEEYAMDLLVGDVLDVADTLGFATFDLVGHDWGGGVAWVLAGRHPERIATLTVASAPHPASFTDAYNTSEGAAADDDQYKRSSYVRVIIEQPGVMEERFLANGKELMQKSFAGLPEDAVAEYLELVGTPEGLRCAFNWYRANGPRPVPREYADIIVPTLYVWSDQDEALGPTAAYATEKHVTGPYRFVEIHGVDHWIPERAADQFNQEMLAHLAAYAP